MKSLYVLCAEDRKARALLESFLTPNSPKQSGSEAWSQKPSFKGEIEHFDKGITGQIIEGREKGINVS